MRFGDVWSVPILILVGSGRALVWLVDTGVFGLEFMRDFLIVLPTN